jgi:uncharacterized protein YndB with AHSA1/START domain
MDAVFKALGDETRRHLLDRLRERDGQTLAELEATLGMTRFGVMKHLKVLEAASLVVTRRSGRFKHHYLNAAPLQEVIDRWIEPLVLKPMAREVLDLKARLEGETEMTTMTETRPDYVLETWIRTDPDTLWKALTEGEMTARYHFAKARFEADLRVGGAYSFVTPEGVRMLSGDFIDIQPGKRLEMTFVPGWMGPDPVASRYVYEIEAAGDACKLTVLHFGLPADQGGVREGWSKVVASLKSYLETGEGLSFPPAAA